MSVLAGSGEQQGKQPGWNSDSGREIGVYGGTHPPEEGIGACNPHLLNGRRDQVYNNVKKFLGVRVLSV